MVLNFNRNWQFIKEDGTIHNITLPHDAMITEKRDINCWNSKQSGYFVGGKYIYKKIFSISEKNLNKVIELYFEGVYQNAQVFINGILSGTHKYGYTPFYIDISEHVKCGENEVEVRVDNSLEPNCRWYSGSGIYRNVSLLIRDKCYIKSVHIETVSILPAVISVDVKMSSPSDFLIEIYNSENELILKTDKKIIEISNAKLWSAETPNLYLCKVKTKTDEIDVSFGIRELKWSAKTGLTVNGKEVLLRGGCIHHDNGILGACCYYDYEYRRVKILKDAGYNAIRCAHNPASAAFLKACDELGMYVMDEVFDGWYIPKNYHDYSRIFYSEWKSDIYAMVENSRNHPCVIMYSIGNEITETVYEKGCKICNEMSQYVHSLDNTRPVTAGINILLNVYVKLGLGVYKDDKSTYSAKPLPHRKKHYREKKYGSEFFNMFTQKLGTFMFYISKGKMGEKAAAAPAKSLDIIGLNYAASRYDCDVKKYPDRMMVGSETMISQLPYNWIRVKKHKAIVGDFAWAAWDYLGEAGVGDWTYYSYKGLPLTAGSGAVDLIGTRTAQSYFQEIVWGLSDKPIICVRPLNHAKETPSKSAWRFTDALYSWSWRGFEGETAFVEVYSSAPYAELILNDRIIGVKKLKNFKTIFKVPYENGIIRVNSLDDSKNIISSNYLKTAESETRLSVHTNKYSLRLNSQDLAIAEIEFTDNEGLLKPYIEQRIDIEIDGDIRLLGFGSAQPKTDEIFNKTYHNSYRGKALAIFTAGDEVGKSIITFHSEGVDDCSIEIEVI